MNTKVLKELLTHGQGGNKVDEESSRDGFPLRRRNMSPDWISSKQEFVAAEKNGER
jgi:hypothetical protein